MNFCLHKVFSDFPKLDHGVTTCVPILDGYSLPHAITRMNIDGNDVREYFSKILWKCGDYKFNTWS